MLPVPNLFGIRRSAADLPGEIIYGDDIYFDATTVSAVFSEPIGSRFDFGIHISVRHNGARMTHPAPCTLFVDSSHIFLPLAARLPAAKKRPPASGGAN